MGGSPLGRSPGKFSPGMGGDVYTIRNGDGSEIGPCSAQTIKVLIAEGVVTSDAAVALESGLVPISRVPKFREALGLPELAAEPPPSPERLAGILFTADLAAGEGAQPLSPELEEKSEARAGPDGPSGQVALGIDPQGRPTATITVAAETEKTISIDLPNKSAKGDETAGDQPRLVSGSIQDLLGPDHPILDPWFAGVLAALWRARETCILDVDAHDVRTTLYLIEGTPVFAAGGIINDSLGRLLIRTGRITEQQLEQAVDHLIEKYGGKDKRIGEIFVELGILSPEQISEALALQTREKILTCFSWMELRYTLSRQEDFEATIPRFDCKVPVLVLEGIRRFYDSERIGRIIEAIRPRLDALTESTIDVARRFGLGPEEAKVLSSLNAGEILGVIERTSRRDPLSAGRFLSALILSASLDVRVGPASPTEILSGPKAPAPWHLLSTRAAERRDERIPPPVVEPTANPHPVRALWAEASFKAGKRLLGRDPRAALERLRQAVNLRPDATEYRMLMVYTEYRVAGSEQERAETGDLAVKLATEALGQDAKVASAHTILGHFEERAGHRDQALRHYKRALELDAWDEEARREFRRLRTGVSS